MKERQYDWVVEPDKKDIYEMLRDVQPVYFQYKENDYLLETYGEGILIADPFPYYENGGYADNPKYQYPESFQAKTVDDFFKLPFLDGKTLFEQWDKIRFWNF
jgi:hypothetical protein